MKKKTLTARADACSAALAAWLAERHARELQEPFVEHDDRQLRQLLLELTGVVVDLTKEVRRLKKRVVGQSQIISELDHRTLGQIRLGGSR